MDVDEFLDRELSELNIPTEKTQKNQTDFEATEFKAEFNASQLFENIKYNLSKGNLDQAERYYVQLWRSLLQGKLKWNDELYGQLSILCKQFLSTINLSYNELKRKADHIYDLLNKARASLKEGKKDVPFKIYSQVQEMYHSIPSVFFEEKRIVQEHVLDFYKELRNTTDDDLIKRVYALIQEINQIIDVINSQIRQYDMSNAMANYGKCVELYNQVPEGFLMHKNSVEIRLLEVYKTLSIYTAISNLQKQLGSSRPNLNSAAPTQKYSTTTLQASQKTALSNPQPAQRTTLPESKRQNAYPRGRQKFQTEDVESDGGEFPTQRRRTPEPSNG